MTLVRVGMEKNFKENEVWLDVLLGQMLPDSRPMSNQDLDISKSEDPNIDKFIAEANLARWYFEIANQEAMEG